MPSNTKDPMFDKGGPALPYAGTTGYSGTGASREMAETEADDGTAAARQRRILAALEAAGPLGVTVAEMRNEKVGDHHGKVSSAFTSLHKVGTVARLRERRERNSIYVLPKFIGNRPTSEYRPRNSGAPAADAKVVEKIVYRDVPRRIAKGDLEFALTVRGRLGAVAEDTVRVKTESVVRLLDIIDGLLAPAEVVAEDSTL